MKTADGFQQTDNAQAAVEIGSRLIVSEAVTDAPNDKEQLVPTLGALSPWWKASPPCSSTADFTAKRPSPPPSKATVGCPRRRSSPPPDGHRTGAPRATRSPRARQIMAHRLATRAGRTLYAQRKQTIEPVFGIIKAALGFRRLLAPSGATLRAAFGRLSRSARLSLRGLTKVRTEWTLVTLAYNLKRLFHLGVDLAAA